MTDRILQGILFAALLTLGIAVISTPWVLVVSAVITGWIHPVWIVVFGVATGWAAMGIYYRWIGEEN